MNTALSVPSRAVCVVAFMDPGLCFAAPGGQSRGWVILNGKIP